MTLYLWHIPAIAVATCLCMPSAPTPSGRHRPGFWVFAPGGGLRTGYGDRVCRAFTAGASAVALVGRACSCHRVALDDRRRVDVFGIAVLLMAKNGLSGEAGWTSLACFVAAAAVARTAARSRRAGIGEPNSDSVA